MNEVALELLDKALEYAKLKSLSVEDASASVLNSYKSILTNIEGYDDDLDYEDYECYCEDCICDDEDDVLKINIIDEDGDIAETVFLETEEL